MTVRPGGGLPDPDPIPDLSSRSAITGNCQSYRVVHLNRSLSSDTFNLQHTVGVDRTAYLSTLSGSDKREGLANIEAKGHIK